jgi:hypothetical protein
MAEEIDLTPTWGEVGNIVRMAVKHESWAALKNADKEIARAFAMAAALTAVVDGLPDPLDKIVNATRAPLLGITLY